jgi:TPR repeat protein
MIAAPIAAQDYDKGAAAYSAGDYVTALREWRPLAEQGYTKAQYKLGRMYNYGKGVSQDFKEAARWYKLAVNKGYANAH